MSRKTYAWCVSILAVLILFAVNFTVMKREALLTQGRVLLLPLAPVDPRSLMQGDYMALRFELARKIEAKADGVAVLDVDSDGVGSFKRISTANEALNPNEVRLRFRLRDQQIKIVTNAYFFQEGTGDKFTAARFGELRVAEDGTALLVGLRDKEKKVIAVDAKKS